MPKSVMPHFLTTPNYCYQPTRTIPSKNKLLLLKLSYICSWEGYLPIRGLPIGEHLLHSDARVPDVTGIEEMLWLWTLQHT